MPARVMSFPFRVDPDGSVATVEHDSDDEFDMLIAIACLTTPGERIQVPTFGVADPAFVGFDPGNLARHVLDFGPPVSIDTATVRPLSDGREEMTVSWTRLESPQ